MVRTVGDEKTAPDLHLMSLCACRSCGDLAPGAIKEIDRLRAALEASVKLQSHYADLLNMADGGQRLQFHDADAWMANRRYP